MNITKEDIKEIPLYNDLISTFPDTDLNNFIQNHCDVKNIQLHMMINGKISVDDIKNYIKFMNLCGLQKSSYEKIVKYININNIDEKNIRI